MTSKEFFDKVVQMREKQKEFFQTRSHNALISSKRLEKEVDDEIKRVEKILEEKDEPQQLKLFQ